jgi:serine/threonine-protein kinase
MGTGRVIAIAFVTALLASTATVFALRILGTSGPPAVEDVPSLAGLRPDQARAVLEAHGLLLAITEEREDPRTEAGRVAEQSPLSGSRVRRGAEIRVIVSRGQTKVEVPPVARLPLDKVQELVTRAGLRVGPVTRIPDPQVPADQVLSSSPTARDKVPRGAEVALVVSSGPNEAKVPLVTGKSLEQAKQILSGAGFKPGKVTYGFDEDRRGGVVIRQTPAADTPAPTGSAVSLVVNESE